jgi:hypothetical protein
MVREFRSALGVREETEGIVFFKRAHVRFQSIYIIPEFPAKACWSTRVTWHNEGGVGILLG